MKKIAILILSLAAALPMKAQWRSMIGDISEKPLASAPIITTKKSDSYISVFIKNSSTSNLDYTGATADYTMLFLENLKEGKWIDDSWDWCGTGKKTFSIEPEKTAEFKIPIEQVTKGRRFYTIFSSKHENAASLVLLYESK
jgi:hypothetical protein